MSREEEAKQVRLFDTRTVERNIRKGLITRKDYEKHLKALSDAADKVAPPEAPRPAVVTPVAAPAAPLGAASDDDLDDSDTDEVALEDDDVEALEAGAEEDDDEDDDDDTDGGDPATANSDRNNIPG
jgi:hypothetical protein